jgi:hypothetical protein
MKEEWLQDISANLGNLMIRKTIEGDIQNSKELAIELAEQMKADGAKEFIHMEEGSL